MNIFVGCRVTKFNCDPINLISHILLKNYEREFNYLSEEGKSITLESRLTMQTPLFNFFRNEYKLILVESTVNMDISNKLHAVSHFNYESTDFMKLPLSYDDNIHYYSISPILKKEASYYLMIFYHRGVEKITALHRFKMNSNCKIDSMEQVDFFYEYYDES